MGEVWGKIDEHEDTRDAKEVKNSPGSGREDAPDAAKTYRK